MRFGLGFLGDANLRDTLAWARELDRAEHLHRIWVADERFLPGLEFIHPRLTTVRARMAELGAAGVERLLLRLEGKDRGAHVHVHPVELVVRDSTAPARVSAR